MPESQIRRYDPMRGDWALDLPPQPGPAASVLGQMVWWLTNMQMARPGITAGVMPLRPKQIGMVDDILRDIRGRMLMLLQGKAPVKEADPDIMRQLVRNSMRYEFVASPPQGAHEIYQGAYRPYEVSGRFPGPVHLSKSTIRKYTAKNLLLVPEAEGPAEPVLSMKTDWFGPSLPIRDRWELMRRGLLP